MSDKISGFVIGMFATSLFFALCVVIPLGAANSAKSAHIAELKAQAIKNGYAQYNPKTGEWTWINPYPPKPEEE